MHDQVYQATCAEGDRNVYAGRMNPHAAASLDGLRPLGWQARLYAWLLDRAQRRRAIKRLRKGHKPLPEHLLTGERGEDAAYFFLAAQGLQVVARRWRSGGHRSDLDLVAWDGETLVVAEVKARTARDAYAAEDAVDRDKRQQLRKLVRQYLRHVPQPFRQYVPVRFDVVSVYLLPGAEPECEWWKSAFPRHDPADEPRRW
ncbi:YraN family protein [Granulicella cerasi]|uniref:UPF0102 protein ACFQBQ_08750 n=1 Tax=Granulicella cerasi TaxID=741063 RepID=A0ABW1ZAU8_9BACT|nr:YraN family protein [Granulicella cerasi]